MCEKASMGWEKYRSWYKDRRIQVCKGFSNIYCITLPYHHPSRAFFCYGTNIIEQKEASSIYWKAYCQPTAKWSQRGFLDELGISRPLYSEGQGINIITNTPHPTPIPAFGKHNFTYLAMTDCKNANPAHCQADGQVAYIIKTLLNADKSSRVVLIQPGKSEAYTWRALFSYVRMNVEEASEMDHEGSESSVRLQVVGLSPGPMYSPHWQANRDNKSCEGKSEVLITYTHSILPSLLLNLRKEYPLLYRDPCGWISREFNPKIPGIVGQSPLHRTGKGSVLVLFRQNQGSTGVALGSGRTITNLNTIIGSLSEKLNRSIVTINPGYEPYLVQMGLVRSAQIVFGMHGGALWGASRWMGKGQTLVEVLPILGPGDTCMKAKMFGANYLALVCKTCRGPHKSGHLDLNKVLSILQTPLKQIEFSDTRCRDIPSMTRGG
ncbi:hypothetical protein AAMO2058_001126800 [Amorphochlora amoebiformis]